MPEWKAPLATRLAPLRLSPAREQEVIEELSQHLDDLYRERRAAGATHEDAIRQALDEIAEHDLLAREMHPLRQARVVLPPPPGTAGVHWFADARQDVVYAVRTLLQARGWALVIVLLLALGIGANTALFTATDALLLASVPARDPDALVRFRWTGQNDAITDRSEYGFIRRLEGQRIGASFSYAVFEELARAGAGKVDLFAGAPIAPITVTVDGRAELANSYAATGNYFEVLGVSASLGRVFTPADDRPEAAPVALVSTKYWRKRFGADPAVLGKVIRINDVPLTIVGVTPASFTGVQRTLDDPPDIWFPLALDRQVRGSAGRSSPSSLTVPTAWWLQVMGRLRPGVTAAQVQASLDGALQATSQAGLQGYLESLTAEQRGSARNRERTKVPQLLVDSGSRGLYDVDDTAKTTATVLNAVVIVILLIICANVANLMLSRAVARRKELSVRLSLGATRGRLVRQLFTEALVLALAGGAVGLVVAFYGVRLLPPPASSVSIFHGRTLLFSGLAALLTSLFFGALPAVRATKVDVNTGLKESARSISGRRSVLARSLLVVQVALSLVLLVGAGLFLQTVANLRRVDVGFDPSRLLLVRLTPADSGYEGPRMVQLYRTLLERLASVPGVQGAALSQPAMLSGSISSTEIYVDAAPPEADGGDREIYTMTVTPSFFQVMGIPVLKGRGIADADAPGAPRVAVINETAARRYFGSEDPIGKRFGQQPDRRSTFLVVGIARDARYASLREPPPPTMYLSFQQSPRAVAVLELRTYGDPAGVAGAVREVVRQIDPNLPLAAVATQEEWMEQRFAQEKMFANAYTLFGGIALLLASIGLFGLMSYNVARRTGEMGLRMALGAQRLDVVRLVMRESLLLVAIGVIAGAVIALASGRFVASQLFETPARDVPTLLTAVVVMGAVAALAAYLPARRASRVDPMVALRQE